MAVERTGGDYAARRRLARGGIHLGDVGGGVLVEQGGDGRLGEALEGLVAPGPRRAWALSVRQRSTVIGSSVRMNLRVSLALGHPLLLWTGSGRPQFYLSKTAVLVQNAPDSEEVDRQ